MALLTDAEIEAGLKTLAGWRRRDDSIVKTFERKDFVGSVDFVASIVAPAEELGHHPDLAIAWNQVEVAITNHAEGGLTPADFELATRIEALA